MAKKGVRSAMRPLLIGQNFREKKPNAPEIQMSEAVVLKNTVKLLIPDRDKKGRYVDCKPVVHFLSEKAMELFGGFQQATVNGGYKNRIGVMSRENVDVVEICFNSNQLVEFSIVVSIFILLLSHALNQESAGFKVNDQLILIPTDRADFKLNNGLNGSK